MALLSPGNPKPSGMPPAGMPAALASPLAWPPRGLGAAASSLAELVLSHAASHLLWAASLFEVSIATFLMLLDPLDLLAGVFLKLLFLDLTVEPAVLCLKFAAATSEHLLYLVSNP